MRHNLIELVVSTFTMGLLAYGNEGAAVVCVGWLAIMAAKLLWELACWVSYGRKIYPRG